MAWSYAAARALDLDASVVFYPESYSNFGDGLVENFTSGNYIGLPLMQKWGMTHASTFPRMMRWLR